MKRYRFRAAAAALAAAALPAWAGDGPARVPALDRPALQSAKAPRMAILSVARADKRLVAVGERGIILLSDDGGRSWRQVQAPTSASLTAVRFVSGQLGWAVGHMGIVLRTDDGGESWARQFDGVEAARLALAAAKESGDQRLIQDAERLVADGADKPFFDVCFISERDGFIVGAYNLIFRTGDGGRTWRSWQVHVGNSNPRGLHLYGLRAVGGALFIVGEQGLMLRSEDGGERFAAVESPYRGSWFGVVPTGAGGLLAYGLRGNAFLSGDFGRSWQQAETGTAAAIAGATLLEDGRLVLASQAGEVLVSADGGRHFTPLPERTGLPLAAIAPGPDGLVLGSLRGVRAVGLPRN